MSSTRASSVTRLLVGVLLLVSCSNATGEADTDTDTDGADGSGSGPEASSTAEPEPEPVADPWTAGNRLQPVLHRDDTAQDRLSHWYDSELGIDCSFVETSGGYACLPTARFDEGAFSDPECSSPAASVVDCRPMPPYGLYAYPDCGAATVVQPTDLLDTVYQFGTDGECVGVPDRQGVRLEPAASSTFVAATRTSREYAGGLGRWEFAADDGTTQWSGPVDVGRNQSCEPIDQGNATACLALPMASFSATPMHIDATCEIGNVALSLTTDSCPSPSFAIGLPGVPYSVLGPVAAGAVWEGDGPRDCVPWDGRLSEIEFFEVGSFTASDAPSLDYDRRGNGRLQLRVPVSTEGDALSQGRWFDTELGVECIYAFEDGGRCVPAERWTLSFYSDAGCSEPLVRSSVSRGDEWHALQGPLVECEYPLLGAGRTGGPYAGEVFVRTASECAMLSSPEPYGPFDTVEVRLLESLPALAEVR